MDENFEFSYWKKPILGKDQPFTFDEFRFNAMALCGLLNNVTDISPYFAAAVKGDGYDALKKHTNHNSITDALSERKNLSSILWGNPTEFSKSDWDRSHIAILSANPHQGTVTLRCDKLDSKDKLTFKGENTSSTIFDSVMDIFHKEGELYVLSGSKTKLSPSRSNN